MSASSIYQDDLAYVHHAGFGDFARGAASGVLALLAEAGVSSGLVVDLACGTGIFARALTDSGYEVVGVDQSLEMLRIARDTAPHAKFVAESLWSFALPRSKAVTVIGEGLNYLGPKQESPSMGQFFARVAAALEPGGLFIFDVMLRSRARAMQYQSWREGEDWTVLIDVSEHPEEQKLTRRIVTFRKVNELYRRTEEVHQVRLFSRKQIERLLRENGFSVKAFHRYGTYPLAPQRLAFIGKKR